MEDTFLQRHFAGIFTVFVSTLLAFGGGVGVAHLGVKEDIRNLQIKDSELTLKLAHLQEREERRGSLAGLIVHSDDLPEGPNKTLPSDTRMRALFDDMMQYHQEEHMRAKAAIAAVSSRIIFSRFEALTEVHYRRASDEMRAGSPIFNLASDIAHKRPFARPEVGTVDR